MILLFKSDLGIIDVGEATLITYNYVLTNMGIFIEICKGVYFSLSLKGISDSLRQPDSFDSSE
jgi:hypothetical protein